MLMEREGLLEAVVAIVTAIVIHGHTHLPLEVTVILPLSRKRQSCDYFFSEKLADASVVSQLTFMVQLPPP
jgi:hypothetical protein